MRLDTFSVNQIIIKSSKKRFEMEKTDTNLNWTIVTVAFPKNVALPFFRTT